MKWFAYRRNDGGIKVKRYDEEFGKDALKAAEDSDFVDYVLKPYEAENRRQAEQIAVRELSHKSNVVI